MVNDTAKPVFKTTIYITDAAHAAYNRMSGRYGGKLAVSAGVILLGRLNPKDRERIIDEANGQAAREDEAVAAQRSGARKRKKAPRSGSKAR